MSKKQILSTVIEQLSCICGQHNIEFLFVAGIDDDGFFTANTTLDLGDNLINFIGQAGVEFEQQESKVFESIKRSYRYHKELEG